MPRSKDRKTNKLIERVVRNEDIFCSILLDQYNRTLRVIDFRGGNFQAKHNYLERVLLSEGMRKIFTLIERDDMSGWQRIGYQREGAIPGYYKRSDAYIMSRTYDADIPIDPTQNGESTEHKEFFVELKTLAKKIAEQKSPGIRTELITESEAIDAIRAEVDRLAKKAKGAKKPPKGKKIDLSAPLGSAPPLFPQFSRSVEYFYFVAQNRRTKQVNVFGAEYQDCFGNAKISTFFTPHTRVDQNLANKGMLEFIECLMEKGAVSIFALARGDDLFMNAVLASVGCRNTGWMYNQLLTDKGPVDQVLWTKKLI